MNEKKNGWLDYVGKERKKERKKEKKNEWLIRLRRERL